MRKLVQVNVTANWGSTGKIAEEIGKKAIQNGWESWIAYGREMTGNGPESASQLIRIGSDADVRMHGIQSRLLDNHGLASKKATAGFLRELERIGPDIVHLHNIHGYYLNYPLLFEGLRKMDVPVVWTFHDCWPFTGHCSYFDAAGCEKWKTQCHDCPNRREYPGSLGLDRSKRNYLLKREIFADYPKLTIVAVSNWLEGLVKQSFLQAVPSLTIHNGIDTGIFNPTQSSEFTSSLLARVKNKKLLLGVASVWDERKGLDDLIEIAKRVDDEWAVAVVGISEKQLKGLPGGVVGIRRTQNQIQLAELYSRASVFLNPTYEDNFPTTNLEAMACGTPVVTYATGGSPEAIDRSTGITVKQGDIAAMIEAAKELSQREGIGRLCRARALTLFDKERAFDAYFELYDKVFSH